MKALVLKEYNRLVYEDVPEPHIAPDEVLVQVKACGICGSDLRNHAQAPIDFQVVTGLFLSTR